MAIKEEVVKSFRDRNRHSHVLYIFFNRWHFVTLPFFGFLYSLQSGTVYSDVVTRAFCSRVEVSHREFKCFTNMSSFLEYKKKKQLAM